MLNSFLSKSLILLCVMILTWSLWGSYSAMTNSLDLKGLALSNSFIIEGICITFLVIFLIAIASRYMNKTVFYFTDCFDLRCSISMDAFCSNTCKI